ncbi:MAG: hypothetical protein AMXMBFR52_12980 [Burkholderiales bacterium]
MPVFRFRQTSKRGGSAVIEQTAVAVRPERLPGVPVATMQTAPASDLIAARKVLTSTGAAFAAAIAVIVSMRTLLSTQMADAKLMPEKSRHSAACRRHITWCDAT